MDNFIESRGNMTEAEWNMYEKHLEKRAREEEEKIKMLRESNLRRRKFEIERILKSCSDRFTREQLEKKSLDNLMMIY